MKIKYFIIFILLIISASCTKKDNFSDNNYLPDIWFSTPDDLIRVKTKEDTIKVNWLYYINIFIIDEENLTPTFLYDGDTLDFFAQEESVINFLTPIYPNDSTYTFQISEPGSYNIEVVTEDSYGLRWGSSFNLFVIDNLVPQASFEVENTGILDPLEITIDASKSFDPDAQWGGKIVEYEYIINNLYPIYTSLSIISYIVEAPGNYTIHVRVRDNDGEWSLAAYKYVNVIE